MNHQSTNQTKKKFPHSCTKKELYAMYILDIPEYRARIYINEIIKEMTGYTNGPVMHIRHITPKQLKEFVDTYGLPRNYEL